MKVSFMLPKIENTLLKKKVCAYAGVSSKSNTQEDSLENQVTYYQDKIQANPAYEFIDIFVDQGISGTKENRPAFQEMLKQCREGKIDLILVKSVSRFARNTLIVLEHVRSLKMLGVEVHFENENIRTLSKDGELMLSVLSAYAEEESRSVSENLKWSIRRGFQKGKVKVNASRFLGYDLDEYGDLVINQEQAEVVKRIFQEYLEGKGTHVIAKELNKENITTVTGGSWRGNSVLNILKNEKYKGDALLQKTYVKDHLDKKQRKNTGQVERFYVKDNHSAIIPEAMWEKVQEKIQKRRKNKGPNRNRYELSGKLICSKCGSKLKRRTWNSGKSSQKVVWQCQKYISEGKEACEGTAIADQVLKELNIKGEIVIKEWVANGEKHYTYTSKGDDNK